MAPENGQLELPTVADAEGCWRAVLARDADRDGSFVYAVRSTGVYCRPSCPAKPPRREQVAFYALPELAERAGFRACRRCRPRDVTADPHVETVRRACRYIEANLEEPLTLAVLGEHVALSPAHLQRTFKRVTGISPRQYADACRLGRLKARLKTRRTVTMAMLEAGYGSSSRLYERAADQLGMTPGTYRRGGRGMQVRYALLDCPLGRLLLAATERGVCAVCIGEADGVLEESLRAEYPAAEVERDDAALRPLAAEMLAHLSGERPHLDLPVDVQATAFQWRVWRELQAIPYGETRTYQQVARAVGRPSAVRAVARACATNPVAVVIPCHRVVRTDGGLGGYRWGLKRKRALLDQERKGAQEAGEGGKAKGAKRRPQAQG
jgi:AraC family transcriptional regulator of adaptative response/methylated-DNA-[protein]-cysteine methyltransferase